MAAELCQNKMGHSFRVPDSWKSLQDILQDTGKQLTSFAKSFKFSASLKSLLLDTLGREVGENLFPFCWMLLWPDDGVLCLTEISKFQEVSFIICFVLLIFIELYIFLCYPCCLSPLLQTSPKVPMFTIS